MHRLSHAVANYVKGHEFKSHRRFLTVHLHANNVSLDNLVKAVYEFTTK